MESTGLWDIKDSEGYIYAAFKIQSDEEVDGGAVSDMAAMYFTVNEIQCQSQREIAFTCLMCRGGNACAIAMVKITKSLHFHLTSRSIRQKWSSTLAVPT
ncbi:hypothetical protein DPX16_6189 [Anabarilius grahami]|uniref:Uncharacterized protein n=1 Tax=Anabarilius grahami TaxID=495550 RepID=A0A3N0Z1V4_ANAGA|nr:hypothetical protein DPX16_6189 [Anabarilius grahami]